MADKALGITLPTRLGANGYFESTTNVAIQIKSNLTNLLLTQKGERIMQPNFGCDIHRIIFEPMTDDGLAEVRATIESAISTWMPFVQLKDVKITKNENANTVLVQIQYQLITNPNLTDTIGLVF